MHEISSQGYPNCHITNFIFEPHQKQKSVPNGNTEYVNVNRTEKKLFLFLWRQYRTK